MAVFHKKRTDGDPAFDVHSFRLVRGFLQNESYKIQFCTTW